MENLRHKIPLITPRLNLRPPTLADVPHIHRAMVAMWSELQQWMSWAYDGEETIEKTEAYVRSRMDYQHDKGIALVGFAANNDCIVSSGLQAVLDKPDEYETGYWVSRAFQGLGYATESTNAAIRYGFEHLNAKAIHINYFADNHKSRNVIEKLGFTFVETRPACHPRCSDGTMVDSHDYIMTDPSVLPPLKVIW